MCADKPSHHPFPQIWDTAGGERFRDISNKYYSGAHGVLIMLDVTDRSTLAHVADFAHDARKYGTPGLKIIVVGTKGDDNSTREVTRAEGEAMAQRHGMQYVETSACSGVGVSEAFEAITRQVVSGGLPQRTAGSKAALGGGAGSGGGGGSSPGRKTCTVA